MTTIDKYDIVKHNGMACCSGSWRYGIEGYISRIRPGDQKYIATSRNGSNFRVCNNCVDVIKPYYPISTGDKVIVPKSCLICKGDEMVGIETEFIEAYYDLYKKRHIFRIKWLERDHPWTACPCCLEVIGRSSANGSATITIGKPRGVSLRMDL